MALQGSSLIPFHFSVELHWSISARQGGWLVTGSAPQGGILFPFQCSREVPVSDSALQGSGLFTFQLRRGVACVRFNSSWECILFNAALQRRHQASSASVIPARAVPCLRLARGVSCFRFKTFWEVHFEGSALQGSGMFPFQHRREIACFRFHFPLKCICRLLLCRGVVSFHFSSAGE